MKFKEEKIWGYKVGDTLNRNKGERKETIKYGRVTWEETCMRRKKTRKGTKKEEGRETGR